jgi:hypothetical protein
VADPAGARHITPMEKIHPYAEAQYRIVARPDATFGVEVTIPDAHPTTVTSFATRADAETWIANHKRQVEGAAASNRSRWAKRR